MKDAAPCTRTFGALRLKAQVFCGDRAAMGPGKADILTAIEREGSISAAARSMGMSYRRAWNLIDEMNRHFTDPLVETTRGGPDNGARVTHTGRVVLQAYRDLELSLLSTADGAPLKTISGLLRDAPKV